VVAALLAALKDHDVTVRSAAAMALGPAAAGEQAFGKILAALFRAFERRGGSLDVIALLTEGRQLPGYRWQPLIERRRRKERLWKIAKATAAGLVIGVALYIGGEWYKDLAETSPTKAFLQAVTAISGLLGLLWGLVLVFRGEKRTLWG